MKLTTKGRYAVTAMLDLALHADGGSTPLADISKRQEVSLSYLEQLFSKLRRKGLVESARGPGGGYRLARDANDIAVIHVLEAIDEDIDATRCGGSADCQHGEPCLTHDLWVDLSHQIHTFLSHISLGDLVQRQAVRVVAKRQDTANQSHYVQLSDIKSSTA
ncbi:MAG: Fe-S cluster assembly transcriptional regulator IscR [Gammaproteobacteria bacterium]|nr:MAG: Fe-S cluster assembly transcriptional regulator IscR [Gammaproteobacteria bacterium]